MTSRDTFIIQDESDLEELDDALEQIRELAEVAATHPDYYLRIDAALRPALTPDGEDTDK